MLVMRKMKTVQFKLICASLTKTDHLICKIRSQY